MKLTHLAGTSLAALVLATAAHADVTPEDVWADWQAAADRWGQQVTAGDTRRQGDDLVISDMRVIQDADGTRVDGTIEEVTFRDQGNGTVAVTMSERYRMTVTTTPPATIETPNPQPVTSQVVLTQEGLRILASGDPGAVDYDLTAARLASQAEGIRDGNGDLAPMTVRMTATNLRTQWSGAERVDLTGKAEAVDIDLSGQDEGMRLDADLRMADVSITVAGQAGGMPAMGFAGQTGFAYAASTWRVDTDSLGDTLLAEGTSGAGTANYDTSAQMLTSDSETQDVTMHLEGSRLPFPMDLRMVSMISSLSMPMVDTPTPESGAFQMAVRMRDVTATDATWNRFDPQGALPRDPAQASVALSAPDLAGSPITIDDLHLSVAGAELTGQGEVVVPAQDPTGVPAGPPRGRIDLTLRGGNALIDRLIAGGILPPQQEMAARMTLGAFGRPVPGQEDTVTSAIQFGNGLSVNGIPLQ